MTVRKVFVTMTMAAAVLLACAALLLGAWAEEARGAFPGENGRIAFVSDRDGDAEIYTIKASGSGLRQITHNTAEESGPAWSPDGTKIAFASNMDGHDREIYVKDLQSGQTTQLTDNDTNPNSGPEGSPISDFSPAWSPDGKRLVFTSNRGADDRLECECVQLHVMNADGTDQRSITSYRAEEYAAVWSPDGTKIAFQRGTEALFHIWVINPDGSGAKNLTPISNGYPIERYPDWSPDGQKLLYALGDNQEPPLEGDIWRMNSDGSNPQQLTSTQAVDLYPVWSPNGRKVVFSRTTFDGGFVRTSDLYTMSPNGTRLKRITNTPSKREYDLDWQRIP